MSRYMPKKYLTRLRKSNSLEGQDCGDSEKTTIVAQPGLNIPESTLIFTNP